MKPIKNSENNVAAGVPQMKFPLQLDSAKLNFGAKTKLRKEKIVMRDSKTGYVYGSRVVYQKVTENLITELMSILREAEEQDKHIDREEALPDSVLTQIKSNVRKGAKDLEQDWSSALELTHKAYEVSEVGRPAPDQTDQWRQYEAMIQFAVRQLASTRGMNGEWRMSAASLHN